MSPLDDELRAALHGRAHDLAPSPDPLAGIERRARRIQRQRVGAAVAGSVLAVGLIAAAVPAIQSSATSQRDLPRVAATPEPTATSTAYALDPGDPWAYRGTPQELLGQGTITTIEREYLVRHPDAQVSLTPLWGKVSEPSGRAEVVFLATVDGRPHWGVAVGSEAGPDFPVDQQLTAPAYALAATLLEPGGVPRLVVVAAPGLQVEYAPTGTVFDQAQQVADGVGIVPLRGELDRDAYRLVDAAGEPVHSAPAPDSGTSAGGGEPATALDPDRPWGARGDLSLLADADLDALRADWAQRHGVDVQLVGVYPLYVQAYEPAAVELVYLMRFRDNPWFWGVSSLQQGRWSWYADSELAPGVTALAAALPGDEGAERLLVVGAPSLGGALYAAAPGELVPMTDLAPGVFVTTIRPGDQDDRFAVVDGDGDLDDPLFEGPAPDFQNAG